MAKWQISYNAVSGALIVPGTITVDGETIKDAEHNAHTKLQQQFSGFEKIEIWSTRQLTDHTLHQEG